MEREQTSYEPSERVICEEWKPVKGYDGFYEVSNYGRVRSVNRVESQRHYSGGEAVYLHKGKIIKSSTSPSGYLTVDLHKNGKTRRFLVHRLVGMHFIKKPEGKNCINHLDADKTNNHASNLEWCTQSENIQYAYDNGTKIPPHMKKVGQYDLQGNLIKEWGSQSMAARELNIHQGNIYKVCSGKRRTTGGFAWRYME